MNNQDGLKIKEKVKNRNEISYRKQKFEEWCRPLERFEIQFKTIGLIIDFHYVISVLFLPKLLNRMQKLYLVH